MRNDIDSMRYKIGDLGYAFVRITPDLSKDTETGKVQLIYYVQPGKKVYINDVIISGNDKTLDRVVQNVLLAPGEEYEMSKIQRS